MKTDSKNSWSFSKLFDIKTIDSPDIIYAFVILRFIATCFITNTHYNDVYPISAIAVGGLIGDVIFFIVSGYVLSHPTQDGFFKWYGKRILRIYPTVLIMTVIYLCCGVFTLAGKNFFGVVNVLIFPTSYVFVGSIMLLYIVLYLCNKITSRKIFLALMAGLGVLYIITYIFVLDKSTYEMNNVNNPMILFLYGFSMLSGCYIRKFAQMKSESKVHRAVFYVSALVCGVIYYMMNNIIRGNAELYKWQFLVPLSLFAFAVLLVLAVRETETLLHKIPMPLLKAVNFIAALTLEIYVVQRPIINALAHIVFPLNWLIITALIVLCALALRILVNVLIQCVRTIGKKVFGKQVHS